MKHRSVIAFVIVTAALFSLPQLSHDLKALKGAVGARLHQELLHAFLNLPAGEPAAAAPAGRPAETLLASCSSSRSGNEGVKGRKGVAGGRAAGRAAENTFEQHAMIGDPVNDPVVNGAKTDIAKAEIREAADKIVAALDELKVVTEVAMITPPETGVGPGALAKALALNDAAFAEERQSHVKADGLRVAYAMTAARSDAKGTEWQKSTEDALRMLNRTLPGTYEFRLLRDGSKAKVLKLKCAECPKSLPRAPRSLPAVAPQPAPSAPVEWASE